MQFTLLKRYLNLSFIESIKKRIKVLTLNESSIISSL